MGESVMTIAQTIMQGLGIMPTKVIANLLKEYKGVGDYEVHTVLWRRAGSKNNKHKFLCKGHSTSYYHDVYTNGKRLYLDTTGGMFLIPNTEKQA
jgi:hypothetical protein